MRYHANTIGSVFLPIYLWEVFKFFMQIFHNLLPTFQSILSFSSDGASNIWVGFLANQLLLPTKCWQWYSLWPRVQRKGALKKSLQPELEQSKNRQGPTPFTANGLLELPNYRSCRKSSLILTVLRRGCKILQSSLGRMPERKPHCWYMAIFTVNNVC